MVKRKPPETAIKYVNFLRKRNPKIIKAYLFGSYAKGNEGPDSDMDIAVIFEDFSDSFDMQVDLMKLRRKFDIVLQLRFFLAYYLLNALIINKTIYYRQ